MYITSKAPERDPQITPGSTLNFEVIKRRASEKLNKPLPDITDQVLGDLVGLTRDAIGRLRRGEFVAKLATAVLFADALELSLDEVVNSEAVGQR